MQNVTSEPPPRCVSWDFDSEGIYTVFAILAIVHNTSISDVCYFTLQSGQQMVVRLIWQNWMKVLSLVAAITSPTLQSLWLVFLLCVCVCVCVLAHYINAIHSFTSNISMSYFYNCIFWIMTVHCMHTHDMYLLLTWYPGHLLNNFVWSNRLVWSRDHGVPFLARYSCWHHCVPPLPQQQHRNQQDLQLIWCVGECGHLSLYQLLLRQYCECQCGPWHRLSM